MITTEITFEEDGMFCNGFMVYPVGDEWEVDDALKSEAFSSLEQAIKYCMEQ